MKLARLKRCLQLPAGDAKPDDWPVGWQFPPESTLPPGYPKPAVAGVTLQAFWSEKWQALVVRCVDKHDEDTDHLDGHSLLIEPSCRVKVNSGIDWTEKVIARVSEYAPKLWGCNVQLEFETLPAEVKVSVFGCEGPRASVGIV